jgi:hypothetical protein
VSNVETYELFVSPEWQSSRTNPAHNLPLLRCSATVSIIPLLPAAELLSFLKQTHGPWTERDVSKALNISAAEAKQVAAAMQLQGYAEPIARTKSWRTTEAGLTVSGAKSARLTRKAVEDALSALRDRIQAINNDKNSEYTVSEAVAFGDFLSQDARVHLPRSVSGLHHERLI